MEPTQDKILEMANKIEEQDFRTVHWVMVQVYGDITEVTREVHAKDICEIVEKEQH